MNAPGINHRHTNTQAGAALVVSLMILLVLTLIGVSGMRGTIMQERMASNTKDRSLAFQAAESAMRDAESYIQAIVTTGDFDGTAGLFGEMQTEPDHLASATWSSAANSVAAADVPESASAPRYFAKQFGTVKGVEGAMNIKGMYGDNKGVGDVTIFRITGRGVGASVDADGASTEVVLRSYYGRIF